MTNITQNNSSVEDKLQAKVDKLYTEKETLTKSNKELTTQNTEINIKNKELTDKNTGLVKEEEILNTKIAELDATQKSLEKAIDIINNKIALETTKLSDATTNNSEKIKELDNNFEFHKSQIEKNIKIIESVKDFKEETCKNLFIYKCALFALLVILVLFTFFSICFSIDTIKFIHTHVVLIPRENLTSVDYILVAVTALISKLPLTFLFIGAMFIIYKLFIVLFTNYEKINSEQRKISSIEAIVNHINSQSAIIINQENFDVSDMDALKVAKEKIKWDTVTKYFESSNNVVHNNENNKDKTYTISDFKELLSLLISAKNNS